MNLSTPDTPSPIPGHRWLTPNQAARVYRRAPRTIRQWCADGTTVSFKIPTYRTWTGLWYLAIPHNLINSMAP